MAQAWGKAGVGVGLGCVEDREGVTARQCGAIEQQAAIAAFFPQRMVLALGGQCSAAGASCADMSMLISMFMSMDTGMDMP